MFLTIPHQAFEIDRVHLNHSFQLDRHGKSIARLTYKDPSIDFHDVSILSPPLRVVDYHADTSRLRVDLVEQPTFHAKLHGLYEAIVAMFYLHQQNFLITGHTAYSLENIRSMFYHLMDGTMLSLYIYPTTMVHTSNGPRRIMELSSGDMIRCVIRFQGVTQLPQYKMRLHHSVPAAWVLS